MVGITGSGHEHIFRTCRIALGEYSIGQHKESKKEEISLKKFAHPTRSLAALPDSCELPEGITMQVENDFWEQVSSKRLVRVRHSVRHSLF